MPWNFVLKIELMLYLTHALVELKSLSRIFMKFCLVVLVLLTIASAAKE